VARRGDRLRRRVSSREASLARRGHPSLSLAASSSIRVEKMPFALSLSKGERQICVKSFVVRQAYPEPDQGLTTNDRSRGGLVQPRFVPHRASAAAAIRLAPAPHRPRQQLRPYVAGPSASGGGIPTLRVGPLLRTSASYSRIASLAGRLATPRAHAASCGLSRSCLLCSLFNALMYALAEATRMSVSEPRPLTMRPSRSSRTVTSPCASVPVVIALTE
jgi:hypothetical protein